MAYDDFGDFGDFGSDISLLGAISDNPEVAGPLIGGGVTQAARIAISRFAANTTWAPKWTNVLATAAGVAVSGAMAMSERYRKTGYAGLATALVIGIPAVLEQWLLPAAGQTKDYLGVVMPEQAALGEWGADEVQMMGLGAVPSGDVQLLDAGAGSTGVLGVTVPEQVAGADDVAGAGFGANFLS